MTRRLTISVPDDVAEQLDAIPERQVSAYVAEALRRRRASDTMRETLAAAGHRTFAYDPDRAMVRLADARTRAEGREAAIVRLAEMLNQDVAEIRAEMDRRAAEAAED